ncbi:MAG: hypothetical protein ACE5MB_06885 [Anaerolineae bacterium]
MAQNPATASIEQMVEAISTLSRQEKEKLLEFLLTSDQLPEGWVEIPAEVIEKTIDEDSADELENWLLAHDPDFIAKMTKARENDLAGRSVPWETVKWTP